MAVGIGPDSDLRFPEAVRRAVLAHLANGDLARAVGIDLVRLLLRGVDRGAVREQWMRRVAKVLEVDFPVAVVGVLEDAPGDFNLAAGRAVDHVVERRRHVTKEFLQVGSVGGLTGEYEAAIALYPWHLHHRGLRIFGIEVARIAMLQRHGLQAAIEMIGPAVIAALKFAGVAFIRGDDQRSPMGALIVDDVNGAVGVAHQHDRLAADEASIIVAGIFDLAFVADIDPGDPENAFQLQLEDDRIGVNLPMNTAGLNKPRRIFEHDRSNRAARGTSKNYPVRRPRTSRRGASGYVAIRPSGGYCRANP